jgi:hypothetical protein
LSAANEALKQLGHKLQSLRFSDFQVVENDLGLGVMSLPWPKQRKPTSSAAGSDVIF